MKKKKSSSGTDDKNYIYGDAGVRDQAACLDRIFRKVDEDGLSQESMQGIRDDIDYIAGLYHMDPHSIILLSAILEKSATSFLIDDEGLARYLGCSNIEFFRYRGLLRAMDKAGIIQARSGGGSRQCYRVTAEMMRAIESNESFKPVKTTGLTAEELFTRFRKHFKAFGKDRIDADRLLEELDKLVEDNGHLLFCRKVKEAGLYTDCSETERRMFFYLCHQLVSYGEKSVEVDTLVLLVHFTEDDALIKRHISNESMPFQQSGLVCFALEDGFADTDALSLSDQVQEEFFSEVELAPEETASQRDLVAADSIQAKELFYNEQEGAQVSRLEALLDPEHFKEVQRRLHSTGMRQGFNAIFYGAPGTGKTASVYELARRTGRDLFRVDMSKLKSKWVGESEKSVRGVFKTYRQLCRSAEMAPILLFNEADAIFSKRIEDVERSVDQMNNAVQNIILEEMESIEGILIATTNLLANLDPAFERRFIYKVEFRLPGSASRARIWRSMIPDLSEEDAAVLADRYAFSGGNIENIARKSTVEYVLSGNATTLSSLDGYCREEILNRKDKRNRIGF